MEKKKGLPIYEMVISDTADNSGVDYVALVDEPAIEERGMWMMFDKQKEFKFKGEPDKQIISGFAMVADMPIYRTDARGEYYVVFKKEVIESILKKFAKNNYFNNVNAMHQDDMKVEGVYMIESFLIDSTKGINTPKGFAKAPDGSWYVSYYVENKQLWDEFLKTGIFKGFSVEGMFGYQLEQKHRVNKEELEFIQVANELLDGLK